MTNAKRLPPITPADEARIQGCIAQDPDNPALTDQELAAMRPAAEVLPPALLAALKRKPGQRGPAKKPTKVQITLRVDPDTLAAFKTSGAGWQSRMNDVLRANAPKERA